MRIDLDRNDLAANIQKQFNTCYPFLKIGFFQAGLNGGTITENYRPAVPAAKNLFIFWKGRYINIDKNRTVAEVEKDFKEQLGIDAQIFRRSGNLWIETTLTGDWTLEQQNKEGEQISSHYPQKNRGSVIDLLSDQNQLDD